MDLVDSLLGELDFQIKKLERIRREQEAEERRLQTGADYSWLVTHWPKSYELPAMQRLELEQLCHKVKAKEYDQVISMFHAAITREPPVQEVARIFRGCIITVIERRPREQTISDWVTRRAQSLTNLRFKPPSRVAPSHHIDIEKEGETELRNTRAYSVPEFSVHSENVVRHVNEEQSYSA